MYSHTEGSSIDHDHGLELAVRPHSANVVALARVVGRLAERVRPAQAVPVRDVVGEEDVLLCWSLGDGLGLRDDEGNEIVIRGRAGVAALGLEEFDEDGCRG